MLDRLFLQSLPRHYRAYVDLHVGLPVAAVRAVLVGVGPKLAFVGVPFGSFGVFKIR